MRLTATIELYREDDKTITVTGDVTVVKPWRGSANSCPSSDDYYGYSEVDDIRATNENGTEVDLTDDETEQAKEELIEAVQP